MATETTLTTERPGPHDTVISDDWEELEPLSAPAVKESQQVVVDFSSTANPKLLRHCASSPNLTGLSFTQVNEIGIDDGFMLADVEEEPEHDSVAESFSVIDSVSSVHSISTQQTIATNTKQPTSTMSWSDRIKKSALEGASSDGKEEKKLEAPRRQRKKQLARIVVKPITRCAKSTGDLQSLSTLHEHNDEEEMMGATDAMEFYHRKAQGAKGRSSGLRMRPDEAKRKQFTLHKKSMQRSGQ